MFIIYENICCFLAAYKKFLKANIMAFVFILQVLQQNKSNPDYFVQRDFLSVN